MSDKSDRSAEQGQGESASRDWRSAMLDELGRIETQMAASISAEGRKPETDSRGVAPLSGHNGEVVLFRYLPFWSPPGKTFLCHRLDASIRLEDRSLATSDQLDRIIQDDDIVRALDQAAISKALADLRQALENDRKYVAVVPIHAQTLTSDKDRTAILAKLEAQPQPIPKLFSIEIGNSQVLRAVDLTSNIWSLHRLCRRIILRHKLDVLPWIQAQHLPLQSVGVSAIVPSSTVPENRAIARMDAFIGSASKFGFETYIYNLRTRSLAFAAIGAGFHHVSGSAIAARTKEVSPLASLPMDDLFRIG